MLGDLSGKKALVTGAGSRRGMGATIAEVLARQGADVAVTDISLKGATDVAASIADAEALALSLDVASWDSVEAAVAAVLSRWGRVDILVNNAGVGPTGVSKDEYVDEHWDVAFDVNVKGAVRCCTAVLPTMRSRQYGKIVNIASISGHSSRGAAGAYGVSKAALLRYTNSLAVEVAPFSVNVNAVCPGAVWTGLQETGFKRPEDIDPQLASMEPYDAFVAYYRNIIPLGRIQSAEDVGKAVAFLASDDAANITGQCLHVDGGVIRG
jgi:NAD(P)-dependent dehydrogenase (short-subunit alcohol dehydrogenase family)